jgi:3-hydroxyacyl-CoA dehydrogenase
MGNINGVTDLAIEHGIAVLSVDSPPVNALSSTVRTGLYLGFRQALQDPAIEAIVLICGGRTFFAGADISELGKPDTGPDFGTVTTAMENASKPVIAAIHGAALGGGLEVALTCHYRVSVPSAKVGLPEVNLGLLPGAGGTQRLPRIVGVERALDLIVSGRAIGAPEALQSGVLDEVVEEGKLREQAIAFARRVLAERRPLKRVRDLEDKIAPARGKPEIFAEFRSKHARAMRGFKAPEAIVQAIEAAVNLPFDAGLKREWELFGELISSKESTAQRYAFFAEREGSKVPGLAPRTATVPVEKVGVVGAGTMGVGIAINFLNAGLPVTLTDSQPGALDRGVEMIRRNYEQAVKRGKLNGADLDKRVALLHPTLDTGALASADLVIEAVYEDLELKKRVFRELDSLVQPGAILASNTSFLDLDQIAAVSARPERVIGMHFFSPANVMRLLEVVRGAKTSPQVLATALQVARRIGKTVVVSRVCNGFIANRAMAPRMAMANELLLEGVLPWDVDRAMVDFGFPMGPFAMLDLVGLDVIGWDRQHSTGATLHGALCEMGRWGQKKGAGYYDYDADRNATPSAAVTQLVERFSSKRSANPASIFTEQIVERLLYPVVNEGAKVLAEGVAIRSSDIDVALMLGYGWPAFTGGPMFWADTIGLPRIVASLDALTSRGGAAVASAELLRSLAAQGRRFQDLEPGEVG